MTESTSNLLVLAARGENGTGLDAALAVWQALRGLAWCGRVEFGESAVPVTPAAAGKQAPIVVLVQARASGREPGTVLVSWPKPCEDGQTVVVIQVEPACEGQKTAAVRRGTDLAVRTAATLMGQLCRSRHCTAQGQGGPLECPRLAATLPVSLHCA